MEYAVLTQYKIFNIRMRLLKKAAPKKDPRNPKGFDNDEKNKAIKLIMKKFNIDERLAKNLFYSKSDRIRDELLELENRQDEKKYNRIVDAGYFLHFYGSKRYKNLIHEEIKSGFITIKKLIPKIHRYPRSYEYVIKKVILKCVSDDKNTFKAIYYLNNPIYGAGYPVITYLKIKNKCQENIFVNCLIEYTSKTKCVVSISKNIDRLMKSFIE
ncbi:MAG: hypothetical protein J5691_05295 [Bacilli bacterium]|nr:hypothetical protein [Bacilli bacterium]